MGKLKLIDFILSTSISRKNCVSKLCEKPTIYLKAFRFVEKISTTCNYIAFIKYYAK